MDKNFKKTNMVISDLRYHHNNPVCELDYKSPFELLVAVILSAQCTDKRVNKVTKELFKIYNTPSDFAKLSENQLAPLIYSCGFYRNKAKNIISASKSIMTEYNGNVPSKVEDLVKLDGVGIKTANVVYSVAFGGQAIAVDTHVFRVSKRIGIASEKTPEKVMKELMNNTDYNNWSDLHHLLIHHGRYICKSQKPQCENCKLNAYCKYYKEIK